MKKLKWIIAREALILIALAVMLHGLLSFLQNTAVVLPQYRLEFADGRSRTIIIHPQIRNDYDFKRLLQESHHPPPKLVEKRVKEFIKREKIKSRLKSVTCVNSKALFLSGLYSSLFGINFLYKLAAVYIALMLLRFILWVRGKH